MHSFFRRFPLLSVFLTLVALFSPCSIHAEDTFPLSRGQAIYVPAYSHIYIGDREHPFYLTVTLSIRNTDPQAPLTLTRADYFDSEGKPLRSFIKEPFVIAPFSSKRFVVSESDKEGGSGASFLVKWQAEKPINQPIIETIMIGTRSQQGISFTSRGQVIATDVK